MVTLEAFHALYTNKAVTSTGVLTAKTKTNKVQATKA